MKLLYLPFILLIMSFESLACSMGMGVYFKQGLPGTYFLEEDYTNYISIFIKNQLGQKQWNLIENQVEFTVPKVAENSSVIPVRINFKNKYGTNKYKEMMLVAIQNIEVLRTRYNDIEIPHRKRQLPIDYRVKTLSMVKPVKLANFIFKQPVFSISSRVRVENASKVMFMIILVPENKEYVSVVLQNGMTTIHRCDSIIYVDGPLTEQLKRSYYYF